MQVMFKALCVSVCVTMLFVGCAKKPRINLANLRENTAGGDAVPGGEGFESAGFVPGGQPPVPVEGDNILNGKGDNLPKGWSGMDKPVDAGDGANAYIKNPQPWNGKVYFDYNRYEIKESERPVLNKLADFLTQNGDKLLVIEGHCDERGSDEYNRALSEKRALAIREYLHDSGVDTARMFTISYGEDRPEVAGATTEAEHRLNRRGQFLFGDKK